MNYAIAGHGNVMRFAIQYIQTTFTTTISRPVIPLWDLQAAVHNEITTHQSRTQ